MHIRPFQALRPVPDQADRVASVPYDVVDASEAAALARGNPASLLHVTRAEIDLPAGVDPYGPAVYARAAEALKAMRRDGLLLQEEAPALYVYRLVMDGREQHGVVGCCSVAEYEAGLIRKHENTRRDKEDDRTRHIEAVNAQTGPVFIAHRDHAAVDALVAEAEAAPALYDFTAPDGIRHTVWGLRDVARACQAFGGIPVCYIADGHHRAAAAARVARNRGAVGTDAEAGWFLAVCFPSSQLRILPYNRCVRDLNGLSPDRFLDAVRAVMTVTTNGPDAPTGPGNASLYLGGRWHGLRWDQPVGGTRAARLDVSILQDWVLGPILGIDDPRTNRRIEFVGGIRGPHELARRVDSGASAVAFSMFPTTLDDLMSVADASEIMPPKSTWFEPKLRDGLLVHAL